MGFDYVFTGFHDFTIDLTKTRKLVQIFHFKIKIRHFIKCVSEPVVKTRAPHVVPMLICQGPSFYLKCLVEKGHNLKI